MRKLFIVLVLAIFSCSCAAAKFTGGMLTHSVIHQAGHYAGAKATGVNIEWVDGFDSIPLFQPNEHMTSDKAEPLAYGGGLLLTGIVSEIILLTIDYDDVDGDKWWTDVMLGYLFMDMGDGFNYGLRRSGLFGGEGQNDLNRRKFGKYHRYAGATVAVHKGTIAYRLQKHKRVKKWYHNIRVFITDKRCGITYLF